MPDLASPSLPPAVLSGKEGGHLSLSGDTLLSPRTLVLSLGASATRNSLQCTDVPASNYLAPLNVSSAVVEKPCCGRSQQPGGRVRADVGTRMWGRGAAPGSTPRRAEGGLPGKART